MTLSNRSTLFFYELHCEITCDRKAISKNLSNIEVRNYNRNRRNQLISAENRFSLHLKPTFKPKNPKIKSVAKINLHWHWNLQPKATVVVSFFVAKKSFYGFSVVLLTNRLLFEIGYFSSEPWLISHELYQRRLDTKVTDLTIFMLLLHWFNLLWF